MPDEILVFVQYEKKGTGRFLSQLDTARAIERALRRAGFPLALTGGFNPRPKISFGPALAVGVEGEAEYAVMTLTARVPLSEILMELTMTLPEGLKLKRAKYMSRAFSPGKLVKAAGYRIEVELGRNVAGAERGELGAAIGRALRSWLCGELVRSRSGIGRPNVELAQIDVTAISRATGRVPGDGDDAKLKLEVVVPVSLLGRIRPDVLMGELGSTFSLKGTKVTRTGLYATSEPVYIEVFDFVDGGQRDSGRR